MRQQRMQLVEEFASQGDAEKAFDFLLAHPILIADDVLNEVHARVKRERGQRSPLFSAFRSLTAVATAYDEDPRSYPLGKGPIETLLARVGKGATLPYLESMAARSEVAGVLSARYVDALCGYAIGEADEGRWRGAVDCVRLLLASCEAPTCAPEDRHRVRMFARRAWITVVTRAITDVPDPRLYRSALDAIGRALADAAGADDEDEVRLRFAAGVLHLDPWIEPRGTQVFEAGIARWRQRFLAEIGPLIATIPEDQRELPTPVEALAIAERHLREASRLGSSLARARALKALVQLLSFRKEILKLDVDVAEMLERCREALCLLGADAPPQLAMALENYLALYSGERHVGPAMTAADLARRRAAKSDVEVAAEVLQALQHFAPRDPAALELLLASSALFAGDVGEHQRVPYYDLAMRLLHDLTDPIPSERVRPGHVREDLRALLAEGTGEDFPFRHDSLLLRVAFMASRVDADDEALALAVREPRLGERLEREIAALPLYVAAVLAQNAGATAVAQARFKDAVARYADSAAWFFALGLDGRGVTIMDRLDDVASRPGEPGVLNALTVALSRVAPYLERFHGDMGTWRVHGICEKAFAAMRPGHVDAGFFLLRQVAKGYRYAGSLTASRRYDWRTDTKAVAQLELIASEEGRAGRQESLPRPVEDEWLLLAYSRRAAATAGGSDAERLVNLRQSFDVHLLDASLGAAGETLPVWLPDEIRARLDDATVLADLLVTPTADGLVELRWMVFTRESVKMIATRHTDPNFTIVLGSEAPVVTSLLGAWVAEVRSAVRTPTERRDATPEALRALQRDFPAVFGDASWLAELKRGGKTRLMLVPQGPLHYYPLHLLSTPTGVLADDWAISYLPNLHVLTRALPPLEKSAPARGEEVLAVGLEYTTFDAGVPMLPAATGEAREIAGLFGATPLIEKDATKRAILDRLPAARVVHVAAHGKLDVDAPAFQCIYTAPEEDGDAGARLSAFDLVGLDLRHVELVTLSACETGLGRFDLADNLRGFPAALLQAGVRHLVVTLWPVDSVAAAKFFVELYAALSAGASVPDAFTRAQRHTRARHPAYRMWGAFVLVG